jgi:hypothetical protein
VLLRCTGSIPSHQLRRQAVKFSEQPGGIRFRLLGFPDEPGEYQARIEQVTVVGNVVRMTLTRDVPEVFDGKLADDD